MKTPGFKSEKGRIYRKYSAPCFTKRNQGLKGELPSVSNSNNMLTRAIYIASHVFPDSFRRTVETWRLVAISDLQVSGTGAVIKKYLVNRKMHK